MPITFTLSTLPPSVNNLFASAKVKKRTETGAIVEVQRRVPVKRYKAWQTAAGWEIRARCIPLTVGKVAVAYEVERPTDKRRHDASNLLKGLDDLLVSCGVIEDDSLIERVTIGWADGLQGVRVTVTALSDAKQGRAA